jgi:hypothetical protein
MKQVGIVLNSVLTVMSLWGGYSHMSPDRLKTNADWIFFTCCLVIGSVAPIALVASSIFGARCETLPRPSWRRFSLSWRHDPLQCLHISIIFTAAYVLGAFFHVPYPTAAGAWAFGSLVALLIGFIAGRFFAYAIFRNRIQSA